MDVPSSIKGGVAQSRLYYSRIQCVLSEAASVSHAKHGLVT